MLCENLLRQPNLSYHGDFWLSKSITPGTVQIISIDFALCLHVKCFAGPLQIPNLSTGPLSIQIV